MNNLLLNFLTYSRLQCLFVCVLPCRHLFSHIIWINTHTHTKSFFCPWIKTAWCFRDVTLPPANKHFDSNRLFFVYLISGLGGIPNHCLLNKGHLLYSHLFLLNELWVCLKEEGRKKRKIPVEQDNIVWIFYKFLREAVIEQDFF